MIAATTCPSDVPNCAGLLDVNLTLVVELVIFLVTCYVLWRLIWKPIIEILEKRDLRLNAGQQAAAEAERRYTQGLAQVQTILEGSRHQAREVVGEAVREATAAAEAERNRAHAEARALTDSALEEINAESAAAVASLRTQAGSLAVQAASRLAGAELDEKTYAKVATQGRQR